MAGRMFIAFGKYLKLVRGRRNMSLSDVVALTKSYPEPVGKGYLSRVERGLARIGFSKMVAHRVRPFPSQVSSDSVRPFSDTSPLSSVNPFRFGVSSRAAQAERDVETVRGECC